MTTKRKKRQPQSRCVYVEGRRQCVRAGSGDPPLCRVHELLLEEEEEYDELDLLDDVAERINNGVEQIAERIRGFFSQGQPAPVFRPGARRSVPPPTNGHRQRTAPATKQPAEDPRFVLGFPPELKLTKEMVKDRKRQLAAVFHPDKPGGSVEAMKRVNTAADSLLKTLR